MEHAIVSAIVVNWNGQRLLERCLSALLAQTCRDLEIILVDNGSTDGSVALVKSRFPTVRLIESPTNLGFAAGNNLGLTAARGRFIALLNNDVFPEPRWLENLLRAMRSDASIGMCASQMVLHSDPGRIDSAGIAIDRAGIAWDRLGGQPVAASESAPVEIFGPCAGAALYRRAMLEDVGFFDEDFFMYLEDVDLAWRARLRGWRCLYVPDAVVRHVHSASGREGSPFKRQQLGRNKIWTIVKNYPSPALWAYLPAILAYDVGSVLVALLTRGDPHPLLGRLRSLRGLPRMWAKRRVIQRRRTAAWRDLAPFIQPLESPWRVQARYAHLGR